MSFSTRTVNFPRKPFLTPEVKSAQRTEHLQPPPAIRPAQPLLGFAILRLRREPSLGKRNIRLLPSVAKTQGHGMVEDFAHSPHSIASLRSAATPNVRVSRPSKLISRPWRGNRNHSLIHRPISIRSKSYTAFRVPSHFALRVRFHRRLFPTVFGGCCLRTRRVLFSAHVRGAAVGLHGVEWCNNNAQRRNHRKAWSDVFGPLTPFGAVCAVAHVQHGRKYRDTDHGIRRRYEPWRHDANPGRQPQARMNSSEVQVRPAFSAVPRWPN